jgi:phage tail sheath gpL-like
LISSVSQAEEFFGVGSQIADMIRGFKENNDTGELWAVALDDGAAVKASGSLAFSGTATESGVVYVYVGGNRVKVVVTTGDSAADVATALKAELDKTENQYLPVTNVKSSGTVSLVAKNGGAAANDLDLRLNYYEGEELPEGLSCTVTQPASGSGAPDIQDAIDAIGAEQYHLIVHPYTDTSNLAAIEAELEDRWGPLAQNDGVALTFKKDSYADLITLGDARNSPHSVILGGNAVPTSPWKVAAAMGGVVAYFGQQDPARPFQTLQLKGVLAPAIGDRLTDAERNLLLQHGIATLKYDSSGLVRLERLVTTYKTNQFGAADTSYRDLNTVLTLSYVRWDWRNYILNKYPRHKLGSDGVRYAAGQPIMTPSVMKSEAIMKFTQWESIGLVEDLEQFKSEVVVERNVSDPNRIDVLLPTNLINQLIVTASQIQFRL